MSVRSVLGSVIAMVVASFLLVSAMFVSNAAAQSRWTWPEKPKNLKVLPKITGGDNLRDVMVGFTRSLGVRCSHCHVGEEGKPLDTYDFPSDQNPKKNVARGMIKMVRKVQKELVSIQPAKAERVNFGCQTCHHGRPLPMTLAEELIRVYSSGGPDSTVARYRSLRERFYGSNSYDFRERSLVEVGDVVLDRKDPRGAIAILNVDAEFYPESGTVHAALGRAYEAAGDKEQAIAHYEKAVAVEPRNQEAKKALEALKGGK